jgi:hypothetical protein
MTKEIARAEETTVAAPDVATNPMHLAAIQGQLVQWCQEKRDEVEREYRVLEAAITEAKRGGFKSRAMDAASRKLVDSLEFYEKVLAVLKLGYMLFPPIDNIEVLAIRSEDGQHHFERTLAGTWGGAPGGVQGADVLPAGDGFYVSPNVHWHKGAIEKTTASDGRTSERQVWYPVAKLDAPDFPLVMARSQSIEATNRAMVELVFDDIAIYPARAKKDPVILGRIFDPTRTRWLCFMISWRVDKRDL